MIEIEVALVITNEVPAILPNLTLVAPRKLVPMMVTTFPPIEDPDATERDVIVGTVR